MSMNLGRRIVVVESTDVEHPLMRTQVFALRLSQYKRDTLTFQPYVIRQNGPFGDILDWSAAGARIRGLQVDATILSDIVKDSIMDSLHEMISNAHKDSRGVYRNVAHRFHPTNSHVWTWRFELSKESGTIDLDLEPQNNAAIRAEAEQGISVTLAKLDDLFYSFGESSNKILVIAEPAMYRRLHADLTKMENVAPSSMKGLHLLVGSANNKPKGLSGVQVIEHTPLGTIYDVPFPKRKSAQRDRLMESYLTDSQKDAQNIAKGMSYSNERLTPDQERAVGVHLSTKRGYVNALSTGDGKTVAALTAFNERYYAKQTENPWRGIVVLEASVRAQWASECKTWLDSDIAVVEIKTRRDATKLLEESNKNTPMLVLCSYNLTVDIDENETEFGKALNSIRFDDAVLDEGRTIRGGGKTSRSLWKLREHSELGTVLCATPVLKSPMDLGRLMAWARGDRKIAHTSLGKMFGGMRTKKDLGKWYGWWGNTLIRSSSASQQHSRQKMGLTKPNVNPKVHRIIATTEEVEVSNMVLGALKTTLNSIIETYKESGGDLSKDEEKRMRGSILATQSLARQASSDVRSLADSKASAVAILKAEGLLSFKEAFVPAKFNWCINTCSSYVADSKPVVVFTEYRATAKRLASALEASGMRAALFIGGASAKRDQELRAFKDGERDVLIATSAAERGLNLPNARCLIHYDMKFTPDVIFQRTGRITRLASRWGQVDILFPVTAGTIDERVFSVAVARAGLAGATASHTVADFANSSEGQIIKAIAPYAKKTSLPKNGTATMLELTRALVD